MSKSKTFRPWNREQTLLLLPSPMEWLPENHLVFFLLALAPELDLSAIYAVYEARDPVSSADPLVMPSRNLPSNAAGDPKANVQRNFTDPDRHNLKGGVGWIQGYNCQAAVDGDHQIIVSVGVSNQASDQHHFVSMLQRIVANTGQLPEKLIADAGYCSTGTIEASEQRGLDAYLSTSRQDHGKRPRPSRGPAPRDLNARGRMDRKLRSKAGQAIYALRKITAEPHRQAAPGCSGSKLREGAPLRAAQPRG